MQQVKQAAQLSAHQARNTPSFTHAQNHTLQHNGATQAPVGPHTVQQQASGIPAQNQQLMGTFSTQQHHQASGQPAQNQQLTGAFLAQQQANQPGYQNPMHSASPPYTGAATVKPSSNMESVLVKMVLPIVFIVVLLIGVLMLFIAGVAYGLITEPVRCLLGLLLATGMYVVGLLQHAYKRPIWGKSLLGGAHGIFIITVSIAHLSYELIGVAFAVILYCIAFGLIIFSALRWRSQLLVTLAIISGYLCMFLIELTNVHAMSFIIIQLIFSISMILLSIKLNYRYAYCFAYMLLHISLLITYGVHEYTSQKYLLAALIVQHLVVFIQYMRQKLIQVEHTIVQLVGILIVISWTAHLYNVAGGISWVYSAVTLLIAISYACALLYFERALSQQSSDQRLLHSLKLRTEFSTIITAFALLCFFTELLGASFIGLILFLIGIALVLYGLRDEHPILRGFGTCMALIGAVAIVIDIPNELLSYELLSWIIMLVSIPIVYRECRSSLENNHLRSTLLPAILWTEAALVFIFFTIIANLIGDSVNSESAQSYMISLAWLIYAIGAITLGSIRKLKQARLTGIILLLVIVVKLIFIDITFLSILAKSLMFTILGAIGIVVSFILYNRTDEK